MENTVIAATAASFTASELLAMTKRGQLFPSDDAGSKTLYRVLLNRWHPDTNKDPQARAVFTHITDLYNRAAPGGATALRLKDGRTIKLRVLREHAFELGRCFVTPTSVLYLIDEAHRALYDAGMTAIRGLTYASDKMRAEFERYFPAAIAFTEFETEQGPLVAFRKDPGVLRLDDLLAHVGGKLDARHAAWVMTRLTNIASYLKWAKLAHGAIDLSTCFVSPEHHTVLLLGGWWYARPFGATLSHLPASSAALRRAVLSPKEIADKAASHRLDLELVRALGRTVLGHTGTAALALDPAVPKPMARWLLSPTGGDAWADFKSWEAARDAAFPVRQFVHLEVSARDVYDA
jgi:hypothetical protein